MKRMYILIVSALQTWAIHAQQGGYNLGSIADSLKQNAYSIVQEYNAYVNIHSKEEGEAQFRQVITVLDEKGKRDADFVYFADKFRTFDGFKGE